MGRRASRELAMKILYRLEIQKDSREEQISEVFEQEKLSDNDKEYIRDIADGVFKNGKYIDGIIEKNSKKWKIDRIPKVDLCILRLSIYEMRFRKDIPSSVSINEAVELAKKYSDFEAGSFVNGVLGKVSDEFENIND